MDSLLELSLIGIVVIMTVPEILSFAYNYTLLKEIENN